MAWRSSRASSPPPPRISSPTGSWYARSAMAGVWWRGASRGCNSAGLRRKFSAWRAARWLRRPVGRFPRERRPVVLERRDKLPLARGEPGSHACGGLAQLRRGILRRKLIEQAATDGDVIELAQGVLQRAQQRRDRLVREAG